MKKGFLSEFFVGIASKRLSAVEANALISNQHEFNGTKPLKNLLGACECEARRFKTHFIYLTDIEDETAVADGEMSWYDSRANQDHRSAECRLYYPTTAVSERAQEGDLLVIARRKDESLLSLITKQASTIDQQVRWLFGLEESEQPGFSFHSEDEADKIELNLPAKFLLEHIGVEVPESNDDYLDEMLAKFEGKFPNTKKFSTYARQTLPDIQSVDDPDSALLAWWEREEILFKTLERKLIEDRLKDGLNPDSFLEFSLSIHQRRKSRAGDALENHVEQVFLDHEINYSREKYTEKKSKPDFIFPGIDRYRDAAFPCAKLSMLGVKSTCKDRWRQVLSEAKRIEEKHLLTLEPGISENQTEEMRDSKVRLVVPRFIHSTFTPEQQSWLMSVDNFVSFVRGKE